MKLVNLSIKIFVGIVLISFIVASNTENKNELTSTTSSESENNLNHGIFLNDKLFKYKNAKKASLSKSKLNTAKAKNQIAKKTTTTSTTKNAKVANSNTATVKSTSTANTKSNNNPNSHHVMDGAILHKGWIKYIKFSVKNGNESNHPTIFKENRQFTEQPKYFPNANLQSKKNGIYEFIRDPNYFLLFVFENHVNIVSSLQVRIKNK